MNWTENWPMGLMWVSVLLFVGALLAVLRFLRNASAGQDGPDWPAETDILGMHTERRRCTRRCVWVGVLAFVVAMALSYVAFAHRPPRDRALPPDGVLWTPEAVLREFFPSSEQVAYEQLSLTPAAQTQLAALTRVNTESPTQLLYVARTGTAIDGYAFLSQIRSGGGPTTFGVQFGPDGRVRRVEVMRLLDPGQQDVFDPRFLDQFEGRTSLDLPGLRRQVTRPIQCTSACREATRVVLQAILFVSEFRSGNAIPTDSPPPDERR